MSYKRLEPGDANGAIPQLAMEAVVCHGPKLLISIAACGICASRPQSVAAAAA